MSYAYVTQESWRHLAPPNQIVSASVPVGLVAAVYFLIKDDEIIYVGQSIDTWKRIRVHASEKRFDRVALLPCPPELLDSLETAYILELRPRLNYALGRSDYSILANEDTPEMPIILSGGEQRCAIAKGISLDSALADKRKFFSDLRSNPQARMRLMP